MTNNDPFENCAALLAAVPLLAGEDLEPEVLEPALRHVASCSGCARALERARLSRSLLATLRVSDSEQDRGPDLWEGVRAGLRAEGLLGGRLLRGEGTGNEGGLGTEQGAAVLAHPARPVQPTAATAAALLGGARRASAWGRLPLQASAAALLLCGGLAVLLSDSLRPGAVHLPGDGGWSLAVETGSNRPGDASEQGEVSKAHALPQALPTLASSTPAFAGELPSSPRSSSVGNITVSQERSVGAAVPRPVRMPGDPTFDSRVRLVSSSGGFVDTGRSEPSGRQLREGECHDRYAGTGPEPLRPSSSPFPLEATPYQPEVWYGEPIDVRQLRWVAQPGFRKLGPVRGLRAASGND